MGNEKFISVPLDPDTAELLERTAKANGRAVGREAAQLIKTGLALPPHGLRVPRDTFARPARRRA